MAHENGDEQRPTKRRHVQGMLDETDPLSPKKGRVGHKLNTHETKAISNHRPRPPGPRPYGTRPRPQEFDDRELKF